MVLQILARGKVYSEQNAKEEQVQGGKSTYGLSLKSELIYTEINQWENTFCSASPSVSKLIERRASKSMGGLFPLLSAQQSLQQL